MHAGWLNSSRTYVRQKQNVSNIFRKFLNAAILRERLATPKTPTHQKFWPLFYIYILKGKGFDINPRGVFLTKKLKGKNKKKGEKIETF